MYVLWYARRVKRRSVPRSMMSAVEGDEAPANAPAGPPQPMTGRQKTVLWIFGLTFALMIFSVIPWGDFSASLESPSPWAGTSPSWPRCSWSAPC